MPNLRTYLKLLGTKNKNLSDATAALYHPNHGSHDVSVHKS